MFSSDIKVEIEEFFEGQCCCIIVMVVLSNGYVMIVDGLVEWMIIMCNEVCYGVIWFLFGCMMLQDVWLVVCVIEVCVGEVDCL